MNEFGKYWNLLLVNPIINLLAAFYKLFEWLHLPGPLGWAIIFLTIAIRILLYPLMNAQLKSAKKTALLKPHIDELSTKHKGNKQALQQAQLALYKEHNINPAAGCLPTLIQFPVLIALYNVFYKLLGNGNLQEFISELNTVLYIPALRLANLDLTFFGVNLSIKPSQWQQYGWWLLSIPVITAFLQWYQTKLMTPPQPEKIVSQNTNASVSNEEKKPDDMADMQKQMMYIMPVMFGFFALQFPIGLALYWNIFGFFGIIQQIRINKLT